MPEPPWTPHGRSDRLLVAGIVLLAFVVRAVPVFRGAGLYGNLGYDDGVYFASTVALVHGVLPYRDFLLLHPPGIALLLAPFALLGSATDPATGFAAARLAFLALGAINAGLVTLVAGRYGRRAALAERGPVRGLVRREPAELSTILIGPQTALLLITVLVLMWGRPLRPRRAAVAGIALGLMVAIQVWGVVPVVIIAGAVALGSFDQAAGDRLRSAVALLAGAAASLAAVCVPFFITAPADFVRYVLLDQLARPNLEVPLSTRLGVLEGLSIRVGHGALLTAAVLVLAIVGAAALVFVAWRVPAARMWCAIVTVEVGYLLISPSFFDHYSGWIAPGAAIVLGTAAALVLASVEGRHPFGTLVKVGYVVIIIGLSVTILRRQGTALQRQLLEADLSGARCVSADSPVLLIETTALLRDLDHGCPLVIDPTGTSYDTDRGRLRAGPVGASRSAAPGYQRAMQEWYAHSDAAMFVRRGSDGLSPATRKAISDALPVVAVHGPVTVMLPRSQPLP